MAQRFRLVHFPYRWFHSFRTTWHNILTIWYDISRGVRNVIRWTPVIWHDQDFDWIYLAEIMEYKLRRMANVIGNGITQSGPRDAKRMLICAEVLKRLREDEYHGVPPYTRRGIEAAEARAAAEQELLGKIIGKHLRGWWD